MPQNVSLTTVARTPGGQQAQLLVSSTGGIVVAGERATSTALNITVPTLVKATPGYLVRVSVAVGGTGTGTVYDAATTSAVAAANQVGAIPAAVGSYAYGLTLTIFRTFWISLERVSDVPSRKGIPPTR